MSLFRELQEFSKRCLLLLEGKPFPEECYQGIYRWPIWAEPAEWYNSKYGLFSSVRRHYILKNPPMVVQDHVSLLIYVPGHQVSKVKISPGNLPNHKLLIPQTSFKPLKLVAVLSLHWAEWRNRDMCRLVEDLRTNMDKMYTAQVPMGTWMFQRTLPGEQMCSIHMPAAVSILIFDYYWKTYLLPFWKFYFS